MSSFTLAASERLRNGVADKTIGVCLGWPPDLLIYVVLVNRDKLAKFGA
jgi:hypothetical protein